jgi:hypothetical protein
MALTRAAFNKFYEDIDPYLETVIGLHFKEQPTMFSQFLNMKTTDSGWIDFATVSEYGLFSQKPELVNAEFDDVIQGPTARATVLTFAKRTLVSEEAIDDKRVPGIIENQLPGILKSGRATQEILGHDLLNSAFTDVITPDGQPLISASHVNLSGSAGDNLETGDLTQASLALAITKIKNQFNDRNLPIMQVPMTLIVAPANEWAAKVILGTPNAVTGGTSVSQPNDINPMAQQNLKLIVSPFLTDANAWFLLADTHGLNWYTRKAMSNWTTKDDVNMSMQIGAKFRVAQAATDWRGIVGSAGA